MGRHKNTSRAEARARALAPFMARFGVDSDRVISEHSGVPLYAVSAMRMALGIAAAGRRTLPSDATPDEVQEAVAARLRANGRSKLLPHLALIGAAPDEEVARIAGVSRQAVSKLRKQLRRPLWSPA